MCQSKQSCGHRVQRLKRDLVRVLLSAGAWAVSAEADDFSEHPGGIQWCWPPGLGEKSPPIPQGKQRASSGGYPRGAPLGSLLHPFLERKGCARPGMRGCPLGPRPALRRSGTCSRFGGTKGIFLTGCRRGGYNICKVIIIFREVALC